MAVKPVKSNKHMETINVIAKESLVNDCDMLDFTKGKSYIVTNPTVKFGENTVAIDNEGVPHRLGNWSKHFEPVTNWDEESCPKCGCHLTECTSTDDYSYICPVCGDEFETPDV